MAVSHFFSTGTLSVDIPYKLTGGSISPSIATVGGVVFAVSSANNADDGNAATLLELYANSGAEYQFLVLDLGAIRKVAKVVVKSATGGSFACRVSAAAPGNNPLAGSAFGTIAGPGNFAFEAAPASGRYVLIVPQNPSNVNAGGADYTIGEVDVYAADTYTLAQLQGIDVGADFQSKNLYDACQVTTFPVDVAHTDGEIIAKCEYAGIEAQTLAALLNSVVTEEDTHMALESPASGFARLPALSAVFTTKDTNGLAMTLSLPRCFAPGLSLPFKRDDYALASVELTAYVSNPADPTSAVAIWEMQQ